jgi:spore germination protein
MKVVTAAILSFFISNVFASHTEKLFYLTPDVVDSSFSKEQLQQVTDHAKSIDILAPQIYQLDDNGVVCGSIDPRLISLAKVYHLQIMPLIINRDFNQEQFHHFLHDSAAQERAISNMLTLCEKYHFYGLQFDFENINFKDKAEFTHFFQTTATRLHEKGFALSIAIVPHLSDDIYSDYDRWVYENWSGAYDYQALGQSGDFISIMSYAKHTTLTTPGPLAAIDWVEKTIQTILKTVPASKVSLGVPVFSGYWKTGKLDIDNISERFTYRAKEFQISYSKVLSLLGQFNQSLVWHDQWKTPYVMYNNHDETEYLFVENAKSFQTKIELAKRYKLRGISVWKLGTEDSAIWQNKNLR